jgi:ubiquinone/menaquinone biosynthesis C-methylase UbiE
MFSIELEPPGDPNPGYFEFDWLSARHPDLYDRFALSTVGLMHELRSVVDLTGLIVCDVGAGTGRSALGAAETASR